ncbi:hypothetical protein K1T36_19695 [Pseudomonas protegens]|nr:hypothetical protein K1T36_19695 [Pseudomonas protegens]
MRYLYKSKYGATTDGEAPEKSLTDAIKKSLSMLGFSADVFLRMFDDTEYPAPLKDEERIEQAELDRQKQERLDYLKLVIETMAGAQSAQELKKIHDVAVRKLTVRNDTKEVERISMQWKPITDEHRMSHALQA